jgi:hypothetical protein
MAIFGRRTVPDFVANRGTAKLLKNLAGATESENPLKLTSDKTNLPQLRARTVYMRAAG